MKKVLSALIITLSMATAHAQHCGEPMHERVEHAAMKLDLSKEQRAQIMAIGHESKQKLMPLRARLKEMRHQINETYKTRFCEPIFN